MRGQLKMVYEHPGNSIIFSFKPNKSEVSAFFDADDGEIYIDKKLGKINREIVYQHENQHRKCFKSKCKCWKKKTEFLCEYHAMRAEFNFVAKNGLLVQKMYFKITIDALNKYLKNMNKIKSWKAHYQALRKVCKLKQFRFLAQKLGFWKDIERLL